ncbi:MAG: anhydro-N-acetylmuramic acid kinase [Candidatus Hydrogenedentota bacterium]
MRFGIGLMSGSSCDGVDAALVRIKGTAPDIRIKLVAFETFTYSHTLKQRLLQSRIDCRELARLHFDLGKIFAEATLSMLTRAREEDVNVDFVASHGHTLSHVPPELGHEGCGTLQIGEAAIIAQTAKVPVIADFRPRDMAAGGQGAPLVPYADWLFFHRDDETVGCLNIGGIANLTVVPPKLEDVFAFDTGPGNMPIDGAVRRITHDKHGVDFKGAGAAKGKIIEPLLKTLTAHPFFDKAPPKSTGREHFAVEEYVPKEFFNTAEYASEDVLATITKAVATSIINACDRFVGPSHALARLIVSGGGVHNRTLMKHLREGMPDMTILTSDQMGLSSDAREAIAFAILGNETMSLAPANLPSATGASRAAVLGKFYWG